MAKENRRKLLNSRFNEINLELFPSLKIHTNEQKAAAKVRFGGLKLQQGRCGGSWTVGILAGFEYAAGGTGTKMRASQG